MNSNDEKRKAYIKLHGQPREVEEIYTTESNMLRICYGRYAGVIPIYIESSILEKALDFCKRRAETRNLYAHDETLLQDMLKDFDSHFRKHHHDDAIGLAQAAIKLDIMSLYDLLFEDVVHMMDQKTPQEIEKFFTIRYDGDDEKLGEMEYLMETAAAPRWAWAWKEKKVESNMLTMKHESKIAAGAVEEEKKFKIEIIKVSPADFKNLDYQQKRYWVHAHFLFKENFEPVEDDPKSEEFKEEEEDNEVKEVSKVPKKNDDHGGCGPRGASWKRTSKPDDDGGSGSRADI